MSKLIMKEPKWWDRMAGNLSDGLTELSNAVSKLFDPPKEVITTPVSSQTTSALYLVRNVVSVKVVGDFGYYDYERARKYVRFAAHSYPGSFSNDILPYGCKIIERHQKSSGLRATLYMVDDEIICAFAGTEAANIKDWEANFTQVVGASQQYEDALEYGRSVCKRFPSREVVFVGHSKGGGEAAYCAYNLGKQAETFNPAGLSIHTKYGKGTVRDDAEVNAYVFSTDILNIFQNAIDCGFWIGTDGDFHLIATLNIQKYGIHGIKGILRYFNVIK